MATTRTITNPWNNRTLPDIFYEDPERIEDAMEQWPTVFRISGLLYGRYRELPNVFIDGGGFIFYNPENGNQRVAPDCYIAFDVDVEAIYENLPNFWIWEVGKAPDFVMEVASPSTAANDLGHKRDLYAELGIAEYWLFDPTGGDLYGQPITGLRLIDGEYHPYELHTAEDGSITSHSELLNLDFHWREDVFNVLDPTTGKTIDMVEVIQERLEEEQAALLKEREARLAAEAEAARLREQLRRLQQQG